MTDTLLAGFVPFVHEPYFDYSNPEIAAQQRQAFVTVRQKYQGQTVPMWLAGHKVEGSPTLEVHNPADRREVLWHYQAASAEQREEAITDANAAYQDWRLSDPLQRASIFVRAAQLLRERRMEFNAVMSLENGKNWAEADGEIAECVDHFEVFAREAVRWADGKPVSPMAEEHVTTVYEPLGVVATISPWNYPSAIPLGMSLGALAAGNTVVWKPAPETPLCSWLLVELLFEAGLPRHTIQLITGNNDVLGDPLVDHPNIRMIAFTGSRATGCRIYQRAAVVQPKQRWLKRVMAEMGGKDPTVVCADADLDAAAMGIVQAAYGYSGQKCSACSRVIAEASIYDQLLDKVMTLTKELTVGLPEENAPVGPVIHERSAEKIMQYVENAKQTCRLVIGGERTNVGDNEGSYISPTIFAEVASDDPLFQDEVFGPVLAFSKADDWQHAIELANDSDYGLTAAFYSSDPHKISHARVLIHVGNLYINRKCTGALSGTHAFGGYGMSGTNAKVGGPDYLFWFMQTKTIAQKY